MKTIKPSEMDLLSRLLGEVSTLRRKWREGNLTVGLRYPIEVSADGGTSRLGASAKWRLGGAGEYPDDDDGERVDSVTLDMQRAKLALEWTQGYRSRGGNEVVMVLEGGMRYDNGEEAAR